MTEDPKLTRRSWIISAVMAVGLVLSYGVLAAQGVLYLLPPLVKPRTRKLFAGQLAEYGLGSVRTVLDLQGNQILVKRGREGIKAYSSVCPHLGCRVHWQQEEGRFFCPCHRGVFDADGVAIAGPPADAGQRLGEVPVTVDTKGGVVYLEVKDLRS